MPSCASPSIVVTLLPSAAEIGSTHERTARPSRCTVQAPQAAMPQPYLVPVRPSVSRIAHRSGISGSTFRVWGVPLTVIVMATEVLSRREAGRRHENTRAGSTCATILRMMKNLPAGRRRVALGALCALMPVVLACAPPAREAADIEEDLLEVTIPRLHELYEARTFTVTEVVQWHLARIHKYDGIYRAVEHVMDADALALAASQDAELKSGNAQRGPLWGVPIVIKANTSIAGKVTTDGWSGFTMPGHELVAPRDATVVAKLKAAGAIIIGHTNMPDFANSDTNRSSSFGRTGNAYDVRFSPGGSSGGTVTAVNANMAVLGTGTDTGNSIRMPAATSALIGVYPTRGLVSTAGIAPLDWLLDNTGPIARNVTDAAIALVGDGGAGSARRQDGRQCRQRPARALHAILEAGCAEGQALRRARVHSRGIRHPVPRSARCDPGKRRRPAT